MKDRIILSESASSQLDIVKRRLQLSGQDDYIPLRIALGRSLQSNVMPEASLAEESVSKNGRKKTLQLTTFEQKEGLLFKALISQKYKRKVEGDEYVDILTQHIEHGLWLITTETEKLTGYDYIVMITNAVNSVGNQNVITTQQDKTDSDVIKVRIGIEKSSQTPIEYAINVANNPHFAIIGGSGSGKTYFLKHLLTEIRRASDFNTHFIIFDYKDGDIAKDANFIEKTSASVINVGNESTPLPLNIFAGADSENEQKGRAERVVEIVKNVEASIGKVQEENLYTAILRAYEVQKPYPDFTTLRDELRLINPKPDSLTSVLRPLVDQGYFATKDQRIFKSWLDRTLVIDIHEIERKELVCFFVLNQVYQELKKKGEAPLNPITNARQLRIIVVIDEAHYFLQNSKRAKILEKMIREIRSSGGAVVLASQSPDDYDQADFNFLELMQFPVILNSTPGSHKFLEQKFSLTSARAKEMLVALSKLNRGEGYVLVDGQPTIAELCK